MTTSQRPWAAQTMLQTPLGPMLIACTEAGLGGCWFDGQQHHPGELHAQNNANHRWLLATARTFDNYWQGAGNAHSQAQTLATLPLDLAGTAFQLAVWQQLRQIALGATVSYGDIARALSRPKAVRAVGAAVGRNPVSVLVPCHRVVGANGSLTGYAGGLDRKVALLELEGVALPTPALIPCPSTDGISGLTA